MLRRATHLAGFTLLFLSHSFNTAVAGWLVDGNPVCTAPGTQQNHSGVADGAGGVYIAWLDARGGNNVYAQRLLGNGTVAPGWPVNGLAITTSGGSGLPYVCSDGSGGLLLVYSLAGVRAQRITAAGAVALSFPPEGKLITTDVLNFTVASDGAGGAYLLRIAPVPSLEFYPRMRLTRITAEGTFAPGWTESGLNLDGDGWSVRPSIYSLKATPEGDALCTWHSYYDGQINNSNGLVARIRRDRSVAIYISLPTPLSGGQAPGVHPVEGSHDGMGGVLASWTDTQPNEFPYTGQSGSFGGRWNASSVSQWPAPTSVPAVLTPVPDGTGAAYLVGKPTGQNAFVVYRRVGNGAIPAGWTEAGIPLSNPVGTQAFSSNVIPSGLLTCWSENTSGAGFDIRAVVLTSAGAVASGWASGGTAVCMAPGNQQAPFLVPDGAGGVIACWVDQRDNATTGSDIYAAKLQPDGVVAAQASLAGASAEPGVIRLHWFSPDGARFVATLERAVDGPGFTPIAEVRADGTGHVRYEDRDVVAGATYRYRLAVDDETGRRTLGEVALRVPDALALALEAARPNPSSGTFTLACVLPSASPARVELLDVSGRRVHTHTFEPARAGLHVLPLNVDLAPGVYVARLTQGGRSVTTRFVRAD